MSKSKDLQSKIERLEKVNESLQKKQTKPLRDEQNELMVAIQSLTQEAREAFPVRGDGELLTHEHLDILSKLGKSARPGTVQGGVN